MLQELVEQIENTASSVLTNNLHTALPGKIVSFNSTNGMAVVRPVGRYMTDSGKTLAYPQISDVPVVFPYSATAKAGIAYPVVKGDSCLIIVSEVELDEWRTGAKSDASLRFDLSSAVCIPGLLKAGNSLVKEACTSKSVVVGSGSTKLAVSSSGVKITGDLTVSGTIHGSVVYP